MNTTDLAFHRSVEADLHNALLYADFLEEQGQLIRAEFIRVQIAITRSAAEELVRRQRQLLRHAFAFVPPLRSLIKSREYSVFSSSDAYIFHHKYIAIFQNGFLWRLHCPIASWRKHGKAILPYGVNFTVVANDMVPVYSNSIKYAWSKVATPYWAYRHLSRGVERLGYREYDTRLDAQNDLSSAIKRAVQN